MPFMSGIRTSVISAAGPAVATRRAAVAPSRAATVR